MNIIKYIILTFLILELSIPKGVLHFSAHLFIHLHHLDEHHHDEEVNFIDLLLDHTHHDENHHHDDMSLNHQHITYANPPAIFSFRNFKFFIKYIFYDCIPKKIIPYYFLYNIEFYQTIWQPPKNKLILAI